MWRAPLRMIALFWPFALVYAMVDGKLRPGAVVFGLVGTGYIVALGYGYVGRVRSMRCVAARLSHSPSNA